MALQNTGDSMLAPANLRQQRGMEIAAIARIERSDSWDEDYLVPSQSDPRHQKYKVHYDSEHPSCNCPDHETRGCKCKHIYAVEFMLRREQHRDGSETVTESVTISKIRKTYPQDWPAYNEAQTNEKRHFQTLLRDLCADLPPLREG